QHAGLQPWLSHVLGLGQQSGEHSRPYAAGGVRAAAERQLHQRLAAAAAVPWDVRHPELPLLPGAVLPTAVPGSGAEQTAHPERQRDRAGGRPTRRRPGRLQRAGGVVVVSRLRLVLAGLLRGLPLTPQPPLPPRGEGEPESLLLPLSPR